MADSLAQKCVEKLGQKQIDLINDDIRIILVDADYTVDLDNHDFLDDIVVGDRIGTAIALAGKSFTAGIFNATSPISYGVTDRTAQGAWIYQHEGTGSQTGLTDATRRLIFWMDGKVSVTVAATANSGATTIAVDPLRAAIASGTVFSLGGVSVTTTALASEGARSLSVTAIGSSISAGASGEASKGAGWPIAASPGGVNVSFNTGTNKIFRIARSV